MLQRSGIIDLNQILGLHFFKAESFAFYQYVTYMFMHGNFSHLFFNMFALWMFGCLLENTWGTKRFLIYYFVTGIGAGIVQELSWIIELRDVIYSSAEMINAGGDLMSKKAFFNEFVTIGASGSVYGILLAFGMMFPNMYVFIYFLFPIKAKWIVIIYGAIELFSGIFSHGSGIAHFAHLGGMIFGFFLILYWRKKARSNTHYHNDF